MEFRVELSILGVRYRCQMDSSNESNGDKGMRAGAGVGYETVDPGLNIEDGPSNLPRAKRSLCFNFGNHYSTQRLRLRSTSSMVSGLCKQCSSGKQAETRYKCSDGHRHCSNACMDRHGCVKSNETKAKQVS